MKKENTMQTNNAYVWPVKITFDRE